MTARVEVQVRNLHLSDRMKQHVQERAGRLDHYLPAIEHVDVELSHHASARQADDRNVAQITARGKGLTLRGEQRASEILAAFDAGVDMVRKQIERYKGRHYRGRGTGQSAAEVAESPTPADDTDRLPPIVARRKQFRILPMDELEAVEQMSLLGHETFFVFYNANTSRIAVLYRRRDGSYGLLEPEVG
ncbi:MAG: ribosome-associated translation inhibitor RaiA [Chloroflexota bacterium]